MTVTSKLKKLVAVAMLGALTFGPAATAIADPINKDTKGSITVHKHFGTGTTEGNGKETTVTNKPLSGVKYKVEKADLDLTKNADWEKAAKLAKGEAVDPEVTFTQEGTEQTTGADGTATFSNLPVGLYKVTETDASGAQQDGKPVSVNKAAPFYVTIPMTDPDNNKDWMYNIHVYPKNQAFDVEKKGMLTAGDTMTYTVTATLPDFGQGKDKYTRYNLWDVMSENHDITTFALTKVEAIAGDEDANATDLSDAANYKVTNPAGENTVKVEFIDAGLTKLTEAKTAGKTQVRYTYTVKLKNTFQKGDLQNDATIIPSEEYKDEPGGGPGGNNTEKFVSFKIKKISSQDGKALEGAKFDLYACNAAGKFVDADGKEADKANALKLATDMTSAADGVTNAARVNTDITKVCAVETSAPAGYTLLTEPVVLDVTDDGTTHEVTHDVKNVPANAGFKMPLTGSQGLALLSIAGICLIVGAIIVTSRERKRA